MAATNKPRANKGERVTVSFHDSIALVKNQIQWTPKGVSLLTKWRFDEGAEVEFGFEHRGKKHRCFGIVVACHPLRRPVGHYSTVLYFVEEPCPKLHRAACACELAPGEKTPAKRAAAGRVPRVLD